VQEYVGADNREYTCTLFSAPAMETPYCIALERELSYGSTIKAQVIRDNSLIDICKRIPAAFPIEGSINVQMRKKKKIPHVFEINPRYSSTSYIRALCGFNDVEMGIEYFHHGRLTPEPEIIDRRVVRYLDEILLPSRGGEHVSGS
jgi:carbamoyl-phosphate synthase large subunit